MILYGKRLTKIQETVPVHCPACGEKALHMDDYVYHFHIWFIPFFPLDTFTKVHCHNCGVGNEQGSSYHPEVGRLVALREPAKTPIYMYSFVGVLAVLALSVIWLFLQPPVQKVRNSTEEIRARGEWLDKKQEGPWTYYDLDGRKTGDYHFQKGRYHGLQVEYYESGDTMRIFSMKHGLADGQDLIFNESGTMVGLKEYEDGWLNGWSRTYSEEGILLSEAWYENGLLEGISKEFYLDGSLKSVSRFVQNRLDSLETTYDQEGNVLSMERYAAGKELETIEINASGGKKMVSKGNGEVITYFPNGQPESITTFRNGHPYGEWKEFFDNGNLKSTGTYDEQHQRLVVSEFDAEGNQLVKDGEGDVEFWEFDWNYLKGTYKAGLEEGIWQYYYYSGVQSNSVPYKAGKVEGEAMHYFENGKLAEIELYQDDQRHGKWISYFENGEKELEGNYENGLRHGTFTFFVNEKPVLKEIWDMGQRKSKEWLLE